MARVKVRVAKEPRAFSNSIKYKPNKENHAEPVTIKQELNPDLIKAEKHTLWEIVQAVFRGIVYLGLCFLGYNAALCFAAVIGGGLVILFERLFNSLTNSTALMDTLQGLFNWACAHSSISVTVLVVLYIIGFCWFIYHFVNRVAESIVEER